MIKTTVYVSLKRDNLDRLLSQNPYVTGTHRLGFHPVEAVQQIPSLLGKCFTTNQDEVLNFLGLLVSENVIPPDGVEVRLIEDGGAFKSYFYDSNGRLKDWPYGFFFLGSEYKDVVSKSKAAVRK
jgi:hypothetical protein